MSTFKNRPPCSVCKKPIPVYSGGARNSPIFTGYVLPETEKDAKGQIKPHVEVTFADGKATVTAVERPSCAECYLAAYAIAHPGVPLPTLRRALSPEEIAEHEEA